MNRKIIMKSPFFLPIIYSKASHKCREIVERFFFANKKIAAIMAILERGHQMAPLQMKNLSFWNAKLRLIF